MDHLIAPLLYLIVGAASGLIAGLLGLSGGVITVPSLFFIFRMLDFPEGSAMHVAIGTSLAAMCFNALSATWAHARRGSVKWKLFWLFFPGILVGSTLGALSAEHFSSLSLEMFFGIFAALLGIHFIHPYLPDWEKKKLPSGGILSLLGCGIAYLSNILGIGGGIITVPTLLHYKVSEKQAIATSAATGFVITLLGALFYLDLGAQDVEIPYALGYLYLPAFIVVGLTSFILAPFGARLAYIISPLILRKVLGVVLFLTGITMLVS